MEQLIELVKKNVGNIDPTQAKVAVETVLNFLKDKLPAPIAAKLEDLVDGKDGDDDDKDGGGIDIGGALGKLF